jgi:hypothetical protein
MSLITPPFAYALVDLAVTPEDSQTLFSNSLCGFVNDGTFLGTEKVDISSLPACCSRRLAHQLPQLSVARLLRLALLDDGTLASGGD